MGIGSNIRALREKYDLTQDQLAEKLGVTRESVHRWETDKMTVRDRHISKMVELFGIEPEDIKSERYGLASQLSGCAPVLPDGAMPVVPSSATVPLLTLGRVHAGAMTDEEEVAHRVEVVYLRRRDSGIEQVDRPSELDIEADLSVRMPKRSPKKKVEVLCEDDETKWFLKKVLPARTYSKCNVISAGLSCGELAELAIRDIPSLENDLFVVDGDATKDANAKVKGSRRLCVLPTGDKNPEMAIYDALSTLPDDGEFWTSMESAYRYSRQMFIRSYEESHEDHYEDKKKKRRADKEWFRAEKARGGLGENGTDGFNQW